MHGTEPGVPYKEVSFIWSSIITGVSHIRRRLLFGGCIQYGTESGVPYKEVSFIWGSIKNRVSHIRRCLLFGGFFSGGFTVLFYYVVGMQLYCADPDVYEVGVHIADVSYFVKAGSALDEEAARRATSVYLVQRVSSHVGSIQLLYSSHIHVCVLWWYVCSVCM